MRKALVAVDQSDISKLLIGYAFNYARNNGIEHLDFIHVMKRTIADQALRGDTIPADREKKTRNIFDAKINYELESSGIPAIPHSLIIYYGISSADTILQRADEEKYDVILIGHRGMSDVKRFFIGSVAANVVRHAPCSVQVFRP